MSASPLLKRRTPGASDYETGGVECAAPQSPTVGAIETPPSHAALNEIVEGVCTLTGADGAAIAFRSAGQIVCRASIGAAPDVGVPLNPDSGLSGECVRTGEAVLCDDTHADARVDPLVCARLGLRSVVIVPLLSGGTVNGLLEVLATRPHAFDASHLSLLQETARALMQPNPPQAAPDQASSPDELEPQREVVVAGVSNHRSRRTLILGALAVGALLVVVGLAWFTTLYSRRARGNSPNVSATENATAPTAPTTLVTEPTPASVPVKSPARGADRSRAIKDAAIPRTGPETPERPQQVTPGENAVRSTVAAPAREAEIAAPNLAQVLGGNLAATGIRDVVGTVSPVAPILAGVPVSTGVTAGKLIRHVDPVYPAAAKAAGLAGAVVLTARITKTGNVEVVRILSGHKILADAAADAVRKWKYDPYRLGGKPLDVEAQITVNFKR